MVAHGIEWWRWQITVSITENHRDEPTNWRPGRLELDSSAPTNCNRSWQRTATVQLENPRITSSEMTHQTALLQLFALSSSHLSESDLFQPFLDR